MATMDAITECDGSPANFLDIPPSASVDRIRIAVDMLLQDSDVSGLLINVFGGGIMRCDAVADAILLSNTSSPISKPIVVRLVGTNAQVALQRLRDSLPVCHDSEDLATAAQQIVKLTRDQASRRSGDNKASKGSWWKRARRALVCLLYTSPSPRDGLLSRMPSSA